MRIQGTTFSDSDPPVLEGLDGFSTEELEAEVKKRKDRQRAEESAKLKSREILVDCPNCGGSGQQRSGADPVSIGTGCTDEFITCRMCKGSRHITAHRA